MLTTVAAQSTAPPRPPPPPPPSIPVLPWPAAGAELAGLCREAAISALREGMDTATHVAARHFDAARAAVRPMLSQQQLAQYESWGRGQRG